MVSVMVMVSHNIRRRIQKELAEKPDKKPLLGYHVESALFGIGMTRQILAPVSLSLSRVRASHQADTLSELSTAL